MIAINNNLHSTPRLKDKLVVGMWRLCSHYMLHKNTGPTEVRELLILEHVAGPKVTPMINIVCVDHVVLNHEITDFSKGTTILIPMFPANPRTSLYVFYFFFTLVAIGQCDHWEAADDHIIYNKMHCTILRQNGEALWQLMMGLKFDGKDSGFTYTVAK